MHRLPGTEMTLVSDTASLVIVGTTPKRGAELVEEVRLVLLAAVDGDPETGHRCILGSCVGSAYMAGQP